MSPTTRNRVHFAEQPAVVVGTGAGPSDEDEDSDQYYERMDSPSPPLVTAQVNTALSSYNEKIMINDQPSVGGYKYVHMYVCMLQFNVVKEFCATCAYFIYVIRIKTFIKVHVTYAFK